MLTTAQATELLTPGAVRGLVRSGRWRSICRGVLLTGNGRLTRDQQLWVAVLATGPGAVLAGVTAAAEAGVRGLRPEPLHVLVPAARRAGRALLRRLPLDMAAVVVHRTPVLPDEITEVLDVLPRAPRRRLVRQTVADIAGGAEALSELDLLALCRRHRLPRPDLRHRRADASGRTRWLDAYWGQWRLHVEADGAHHMDVRRWAEDMRRQNDVWTDGDRILRFPAWLVRSRPDEVAAALRRALLAAGWHPEG